MRHTLQTYLLAVFAATTISVSPAASVTLSLQPIDFGQVTVGQSVTIPFPYAYITDDNDYLLRQRFFSITCSSSECPFHDANIQGTSEPPYIPFPTAVTFTPTSVGLFSSELYGFVSFWTWTLVSVTHIESEKRVEIRGEGVAPVPIPAALPLFAGGLGFFGWMTRRRRKSEQFA